MPFADKEKANIEMQTQNLDKFEQCRNCKQWKNTRHLCMGKCVRFGLNTYANYWCDEFVFGKLWSEREKLWNETRSKEPLGNMPFIDTRGVPDI